MNNHECFIGLISNWEDFNFISFKDLKEAYNTDVNNYNSLLVGINRYSLRDYLDQRKSTNLYRFLYCPICGNRIDWKELRKSISLESKEELRN